MIPSSVANPLHLGIDAAASFAQADLARCPNVQAHWRQAGLTIARLGGEALWAPPAQLIGDHGPLFDTWTQARAKAEAWWAHPADPVTWDNDNDALFPMDLDDLTDEALLQLAAENLEDANDMVDGSDPHADVRIDMGQDIVEQAVMTLVVHRGWAVADPRLAPYVAHAPQAVPRPRVREERHMPEHLALLARAAYRQAQLFQWGETWRLFPQHLEEGIGEGVCLTVSVDLKQRHTREELEALSALVRVQQTSPTDHWAIHCLTVPGQRDIAQCSVRVPLAPSVAQRDAVVALFSSPDIRWVRAVVELIHSLENKVHVHTDSQLTWERYTAQRWADDLFSVTG